jgi:hypothetical protein
LASVATLSGHWIQAVGSYQEVLRNPLASPDIRNGARKDLDDLYRNHLPQLLLSETYVELRSGSIARTSVDYNRPLNGTYRFGLLFERDDVTIEQAPFLRSTASDRYDVSVRLEAHRDHAWHSKIWLGTTDQGALYGGQVTRLMGPDRDLNLAFHANQRATDSLLLETLGGRQDELSLRWNTLLPLQITLSATLQGRRAFVDDATLGDGYGLYLQLERSLFKEPDLRIGYRGIVTHFSFSSQDATLVNPVAATGARQADKLLILDNLASSINLQGLYLSLESHLTQQWSSRLRLGSDYSFERSSFGYDIEGSLSFFPRRGSEFTLEIGHSTSATTSDRDSERLQFSLAIRNYF